MKWQRKREKEGEQAASLREGERETADATLCHDNETRPAWGTGNVRETGVGSPCAPEEGGVVGAVVGQAASPTRKLTTNATKPLVQRGTMRGRSH